MANSRIPENLLNALLLEKGESVLASWRCLRSTEESEQRKKEIVASIAMAPLTGGASLAYSPTQKGHLVLTDRTLAFIEDALIGSSHGFESAIRLEQVTDISIADELVIEAEGLGWKWCLRSFEIEGFASVSTNINSVAELVREAVDRRIAEIEKEKKDRRERIESFESELHRTT